VKRVLVLISCVALTACNPLTIDDFRRPFACDHKGGDGGECARGWACGYDDRCFDNKLDGGQFPAQWRCEADRHCPTRWHCGQEVDGERFCQELGVGAPSPCATTDGGCEGGWRCGAELKCFDPSIPDGGTERACSPLADQCPTAFRCGEKVEGREQRCIELGVGADSDCETDDGCEGGRRCNVYANRCVEVLDVITTGQTSTLTAAELSPRRHEPAPVAFAMTRIVRVPALPGLTTFERDGVLSAAVSGDGGLRVTVQFRDEVRGDGGEVKALHEWEWRLPGAVGDLTDLAISSTGPAVRFLDGGATRFWLTDGGSESLGAVDFLRQRDPMQNNVLSGLVVVRNTDVQVDGLPVVTFPSRVQEVVAAREGLYALTEAGSFFATDAGQMPLLLAGMQPLSLPVHARSVVAGYVGGMGPQQSFSMYVEVPRTNGSFGVVSVSDTPMNWEASPVSSACPDGGSALQLAMDLDDDNRSLLVARCASDAQGTSFPVQARFRGIFSEYRGVIEDQLPFQWGVVSQRASPFVRAHAGADARFWHAVDTTDRALLGRLPLRPVLLDRQPDAMISFRDQGSGTIRVFAQAAGNVFVGDPAGGFVSQFEAPEVTLISVITSRSWIVANLGLLDAQGGMPRLIATLPAGASFVAPATGVSVKMQIGAALRDVVLVASGDSLWLADVTEAQTGIFAQPALFSRVLVPVPGVALRSMTLTPADAGSLGGFLTTNSQNLRFGTTDLLRWSQDAVATPTLDALPLEVWTEPDGGARTGYGDGRVWSLPIMVPLTEKLRGRDGGVLPVNDFARKCGDAFVVSSEGLFRAEAPTVDGGLPGWKAVSLPVALDSTDSLRLFETRDERDRLFIGTKSGQVVEVIGSCRP
jgi:hypothetical protein